MPDYIDWLLPGEFNKKSHNNIKSFINLKYTFFRQQSKHLGINGAQKVQGVSVAAGRDRREHSSEEIIDSSNKESSNPEVLDMITSESNLNTHKQLPSNSMNNEMMSSSEESNVELIYTTTTSAPSILETSTSSTTDPDSEAVTLIPWELIQKGGHFEKFNIFNKAKLQKMQKFPVYRQDQIKVVIHNITQITEEELEKGRSLSSSSLDDDVNEKM